MRARDVQTLAVTTSKMKKSKKQINQISLAKNQDSGASLSEKKKEKSRLRDAHNNFERN